jgi:hypothetical protein
MSHGTMCRVQLVMKSFVAAVQAARILRLAQLPHQGRIPILLQERTITRLLQKTPHQQAITAVMPVVIIQLRYQQGLFHSGLPNLSMELSR